VDVGEFANRISFRFFDVDTPFDLRRYQYFRLNLLLRRFGISLEIANTRLPEERRAMRRRLAPLIWMPRMSTYATAAIVNKGVRAMPSGTVFLNIGVYYGFTYFAGMAENADRRSVGVDNFSEFGGRDPGGPRDSFLARFEQLRGPHDEFHDVDYREYFERLHGDAPIGFYIYDGGHAYEDQLLGLELADPYLVPGSLVLVDDTNWDNPRRATLDFMAKHEGRYELLADRRTIKNLHPTLWNGIMLLRRR
jgi:methyltransferase family protein